MAKKKVKKLTAAQKRHNTDLRLRRKYNHTLTECEEMLDGQGNVCIICLRPAKNIRLSIDHDHKLKYLKIETVKTKNGWKAKCIKYPKVRGKGTTKSEAIQQVRRKLLRLSVRGILCWQCNPGLRKYSDSYKRLYRAYKYLKRYYLKLKDLENL